MTSKALHVGMISNLYYPHVGGAERQAQQLAARLIKSGTRVDIITQKNNDLPNFEIIDNVPIYRILSYYELKKSPLLRYVLNIRAGRQISSNSMASVASVRKIIKNSDFRSNMKKRIIEEYSLLGIWPPLLLHSFRHQYDILHFHLLSTFNMLESFPKTYLNLPKILKIGHTKDFDELHEGNRELYFRDTINRHFSALICISSEIQKRCLGLGIMPEKLIRIPNGVDIEHYAPPSMQEKIQLRDKLGISDRFVILSVGSQQQVKGIKYLLLSIAELKKRINNLLYLHIGRRDNATDEILDIINRHALQSYVSFPGEIQDIRPYLHATDIYAHPSLGEGLSNSLLEAMSSGLPVVASDVSGSQDIVKTGKTGILVSPGNVRDLIAAIHAIYENNDIKNEYGVATRLLIENNYSLEIITSKYNELYRRMLL